MIGIVNPKIHFNCKLHFEVISCMYIQMEPSIKGEGRRNGPKHLPRSTTTTWMRKVRKLALVELLSTSDGHIMPTWYKNKILTASLGDK